MFNNVNKSLFCIFIKKKKKIATDIISSSFVTLGIESQVEGIALWDIQYAILCSVLFCKSSNSFYVYRKCKLRKYAYCIVQK